MLRHRILWRQLPEWALLSGRQHVLRWKMLRHVLLCQHWNVLRVPAQHRNLLHWWRLLPDRPVLLRHRLLPNRADLLCRQMLRHPFLLREHRHLLPIRTPYRQLLPRWRVLPARPDVLWRWLLQTGNPGLPRWPVLQRIARHCATSDRRRS
jgi:hypothetical protein